MFTGIIEKTGTIEATDVSGQPCSIAIRHDPFDRPLCPGESVCVDGVCLTVTDIQDGLFKCNVLEETLNRTSLKNVRHGRRVNLERAVPADGRFGGHFVSGHVDCVSPVRTVAGEGGDRVVTVAPGSDFMEGIVDKGSVALNGVSLTVCDAGSETFAVKIIPFTMSHTNLGDLEAGSEVNIEFDMIGKYVRRTLEKGTSDVTEEKLRNAGFIL